jgi:CheY-like chemotaxis protein
MTSTGRDYLTGPATRDRCTSNQPISARFSQATRGQVTQPLTNSAGRGNFPVIPQTNFPVIPTNKKKNRPVMFLHQKYEMSQMATARVLVIDDEPVFLHAVSKALDKHGYDVLAADGPRQALEIIRNHRPLDVVISDVGMPEMRGTELVRVIAQLLPQTASILMTGGIVHPADVPEGVHLLRKPFSTPDLIAAVQEAIAHSVDLRAKLRALIERCAELRAEARLLRSESNQVVRQSRLKMEQLNRKLRTAMEEAGSSLT